MFSFSFLICYSIFIISHFLFSRPCLLVCRLSISGFTVFSRGRMWAWATRRSVSYTCCHRSRISFSPLPLSFFLWFPAFLITPIYFLAYVANNYIPPRLTTMRNFDKKQKLWYTYYRKEKRGRSLARGDFLRHGIRRYGIHDAAHGHHGQQHQRRFWHNIHGVDEEKADGGGGQLCAGLV